MEGDDNAVRRELGQASSSTGRWDGVKHAITVLCVCMLFGAACGGVEMLIKLAVGG
jgi:hypothetical protein